MSGQTPTVPATHMHPVSPRKQKCALFPLQVSLPAVHGLRVQVGGHSHPREKRSRSGQGEPDCLHPRPLCPRRGSPSGQSLWVRDQAWRPTPPILLPTICSSPTQALQCCCLPTRGLCDFGQAAESLWASVSSSVKWE